MTEKEKDELFEKNFQIQLEKRNKEHEDYLRRKALAKKEKKELLDLYLPTEYLENGYFNSKEFKKIESKIELTLNVYLYLNGAMNHTLYGYYGLKLFLKEQILKEKYNIIWKDISYILPEEIQNKCDEIEKKYKVY